jgi:hypothetical protein
MDLSPQDSFEKQIKAAFHAEILESTKLEPPHFMQNQHWSKLDFLIGFGNLVAALLLALLTYPTVQDNSLAAKFAAKMEPKAISESLDKAFEGLTTLRESLKITNNIGDRDEN